MYYAKPTALTFVSAQTCSNVTVSNMDAIGEGAYAQVYKCEMMGYELVLKVLNFNMNSPSELKIVKDCYDRAKSACILLEYCPEGDLEQILQSQYLTMAQVSQYAKDILSALVYLRNMHIVHADLKPANIMVCGKHVKLVDFGLSFECHPNNYGCTNTAGSPVYSAPELITHTPYNPYIAAAWSFGVVLYEMLYRSNPYESKIREIEKQNLSFPEMLVKLVHHMKNSNVVFPDNERKKMWNISEKYSPVPESVKDTITKCMTLDTTKRYTLDSLLQCDLIKNTSF